MPSLPGAEFNFEDFTKSTSDWASGGRTEEFLMKEGESGSQNFLKESTISIKEAFLPPKILLKYSMKKDWAEEI
jgi:hypothetical protein